MVIRSMKYDDFTVGQSFTTDPVTLGKEDIIKFAETYDPQYFHIDEDAAKSGPFGNIIASGFHTLLVVWREFVRMDILGFDGMGGVGIEQLQWVKPVCPGDRLTGTFTILHKRLLSDGKRGLITFQIVIRNQDDEEVLTYQSKGLIRR